MRNGEWDVWKAHTIRDEEVQLTDAKGLDDGPEYSYDGQWISLTATVQGGCISTGCDPTG